MLPTRELAVQVTEVFREFLPSSLSLVLLIGGTETERDIIRINEEGYVRGMIDPAAVTLFLSELQLL